MSAKVNAVQIVEVGLRDGLQNESHFFDLEERLFMAESLIQAGLKRIELGAFVREDRVPQMQYSAQLIEKVNTQFGKQIKASALVPNVIGLQAALKTSIKEIAVFAACSESFSKKNINCSIEESFERFTPVFKLAKKNKLRIRGYLSTCFACPYEGPVSAKKVIELAGRLYKLGCYEISIGDTIGAAGPSEVENLFKDLKKQIPAKHLAGHFHDTRGTALANIFAAFKCGVRVFDASIAGLGGCPFAPGASGNVATEDVVYLFERMQVKTGVDLEKLVALNHWLQQKMQKPLPAKLGRAGRLKPLGKV